MTLDAATRTALEGITTATLTTVLLKKGLRNVWMRGAMPIKPGQPRIVGRAFTLLRQPNGVTMRREQWNLEKWVNTFIYFVKVNGELDALYKKWFKEPLPNLPVF